jgi:exosome complex RNA-binding protein Csl4
MNEATGQYSSSFDATPDILDNNHDDLSISVSFSGSDSNLSLSLPFGTDPSVNIIQKKQNTTVPAVGDSVTCKVTKINSRLAMVDILCINTEKGPKLLQESFPGTIRSRDIRQFDVDTVDVYESFRPGDIVHAEVNARI